MRRYFLLMLVVSPQTCSPRGDALDSAAAIFWEAARFFFEKIWASSPLYPKWSMPLLKFWYGSPPPPLDQCCPKDPQKVQIMSWSLPWVRGDFLLLIVPPKNQAFPLCVMLSQCIQSTYQPSCNFPKSHLIFFSYSLGCASLERIFKDAVVMSLGENHPFSLWKVASYSHLWLCIIMGILS